MADEDQIKTIEVSGADLADAMKIASTGTSGSDEVRIESGNNELVVSGPGASMCIDAEGSWDGYAFVPAKLLHAAVRKLEDTAILHLRFEDGRFYLNTFSIPARWQDIAPPPVDLPIGASALEVLIINEIHPPAVIQSSGFAPRVEAEKSELNNRLNKVAELLGTYSVSREEIANLVMEKIAELAAARRSMAS